jgi:hypothetical protein
LTQPKDCEYATGEELKALELAHLKFGVPVQILDKEGSQGGWRDRHSDYRNIPFNHEAYYYRIKESKNEKQT